MSNKRGWHRPEKITRKFDDCHRQLAADKDLDEVCRLQTGTRTGQVSTIRW